MQPWNFIFFISVSCTAFEIEDEPEFCSPEGPGACDYGFVAFLFNPRMPDIACMGALITDFWIIDNCVDEPGFIYERIKLGSMDRYSPDSNSGYIYNIAKRILHEDYRRVKFQIEGWDTQYMYAAENAISFHKTDREVIMVPYVVSSIAVYKNYFRPLTGTIIYLRNMILTNGEFAAISRTACNEKFKPNFGSYKITVSEKQLCFNSSRVTSNDCCSSQGLLIYHGRLAGVMAWSTGCSEQLGVDPWVFTFLRSYKNLIKRITNLEEYSDFVSFNIEERLLAATK